MFDRVLNMPVVTVLSYFAVALRGIHRNVDICQNDYKIPSKPELFPYSEVIHESTKFKLTKG